LLFFWDFRCLPAEPQWGIKKKKNTEVGEKETEAEPEAPASGQHFVNNEDVFEIFKFLQMFFRVGT